MQIMGKSEMKKLKILAKVENLDEVIDFINEQLNQVGCSTEMKNEIDLAAEELFVNIARYAYPSDNMGNAVIQTSITTEPKTLKLTFIDWGIPYNPLERSDPNVKAIPLEKRRNGGMGIYIVKKSMDDIAYQYTDGKNILRISKVIGS